jgi:hypothetical protein
MPELRDCGEHQGDLESLVRSAKDYVRASDDLRPRVLEAVRWQRDERRAIRYLRRVAIVVVALGLVAGALRQRLELVGNRPSGILAAAAAIQFAPVAEAAPDLDVNWSMVESFTELRRRQAEVLRPAADATVKRKQG